MLRERKRAVSRGVKCFCGSKPAFCACVLCGDVEDVWWCGGANSGLMCGGVIVIYVVSEKKEELGERTSTQRPS